MRINAYHFLLKKKQTDKPINIYDTFPDLFNYLTRVSFVYIYILLLWSKSPGGVPFASISPISLANAFY